MIHFQDIQFRYEGTISSEIGEPLLSEGLGKVSCGKRGQLFHERSDFV